MGGRAGIGAWLLDVPRGEPGQVARGLQVPCGPLRQVDLRGVCVGPADARGAGPGSSAPPHRAPTQPITLMDAPAGSRRGQPEAPGGPVGAGCSELGSRRPPFHPGRAEPAPAPRGKVRAASQCGGEGAADRSALCGHRVDLPEVQG